MTPAERYAQLPPPFTPRIEDAIVALGQLARYEDAVRYARELASGLHCPGCQIAMLGKACSDLEERHEAWARMPAARAEVAARQAERRAVWDAAHARLEQAARGGRVDGFAPIVVAPW